MSSLHLAIFCFSLACIVCSVFFSTQKMMGVLLSALAVLCGATLLVTLSLRLLPGNPIDVILGERATQEARLQMGQYLGLLDATGAPLSYIDQYGLFVRNVFSNSLLSYRSQQPVFALIAKRLPYTIELTLTSIVIAVLLGVMLGIWAARHPKKWQDKTAMTLTALSIAIPRFWLGPLLILLFGIVLHWLPVSGAKDGLSSLVLPSLSLGTAMAAILARMTRHNLMDVLKEDFIRTARAKGLSENRVFYHHALRNTLLVLITLIGLQLGSLLTGTVVIEKVFNWPGIGLLLLESIQQIDIPMVQGIVLFFAFIYVTINLLTEWIYRLCDPRLRS